MKTASIFAHLGHVTAIAFKGEASNYNGLQVHVVEAEDADFEAVLLEACPGGVGSPWPPVSAESPVKPKASKKAAE